MDGSFKLGERMSLRELLVKIIQAVISHNIDYIVEEGTSGRWLYRKWNSGKAELWGKFSQTQTAYADNHFVIGSKSISGYPFSISSPIAQATAGKIGTGTASISYDYERTDYWSGIISNNHGTITKGTSMLVSWYTYVICDWK